MSGKQKKVSELQYECEELIRSKKRVQGELDETVARAVLEREAQREMQGRLESLISEVQFLKSLTKQHKKQASAGSSNLTSSSNNSSSLL